MTFLVFFHLFYRDEAALIITILYKSFVNMPIRSKIRGIKQSQTC